MFPFFLVFGLQIFKHQFWETWAVLPGTKALETQKVCLSLAFSHLISEGSSHCKQQGKGFSSLLTFVNSVAVLHLEVLTLVITCPVDSVLSINKACAISAAAIFFQKRHAYVNAVVQTGASSFSRLRWGEDLETKDRRTWELFLKYSFQKHIK